MSEKEKWEPKNCWTNREEITDKPRLRVLFRQKLAIRTSSGLREIEFCLPPILIKMQVVLNQGSASIGIIPDSIPMDDRIDQRQGKQK